MYVQHPVHPRLLGLVHRICGFELRLDPRSVHHGLPGPTATVVLNFQEPLDVAWLGDDRSRVSRWSLVSGLHTRPALIRTHGIQHGIQLDLTPAGCRALLGVPPAAIVRGLDDLRDMPCGLPERLSARLATASWPERFRLLETHLLGLAVRDTVPLAPDLAHAWRLLGASRGRIAVNTLAAEVGWSRRHLVNRFTAEFGLPPRDIARLHRFGAAVDVARGGRPWAEVAALAGYADQAHLSREFRDLAGAMPTQWRAEVFPIVQEAAP